MPDNLSRKGQRLKTGCEGCRTRRVKCDEQKPVCGGCRRKGQECVFNNWVHVNVRTDTASQSQVPPTIDFAVAQQPPKKFVTSTSTKLRSSTGSNRVAKAPLNKRSDTVPKPDLLRMFFDFESYQANPFLCSPTDVLLGMDENAIFEHFINNTVPKLVVSDGPFKDRLRWAFRSVCSSSTLMFNLAVAYGASHMAQQHGSSETNTLNRLVERSYKEVDALVEFLLAHPFHTNIEVSGNSRLVFVLCALLASLEVDRGYMQSWLKYATLAVRLVTRRAKEFPGSIQSMTLTTGNEMGVLESLAMRYVGQIIGVTNIVGSADISFAGNFDVSWWPKWNEDYDPATGIDLNFVSFYAEIAQLIYKKKNGLSSSSTTVTQFHHSTIRALNKLSYSIESNSESKDADILRLALFHMSLQIHIYRRALGLGMRHQLVRHKLSQMHRVLEEFCPPDSPRNSTISFILATLACETDSNDVSRRDALSRRLKAMDTGDVMYNKNAREVIEQHWRSGAQILITSSFPVSL